MRRNHALAVVVSALLASCGSTRTDGFGPDDGGPGSGDGGLGADGVLGQDMPTFGGTCNGGSTAVTGTVYAPNGVDPLPNISVYAASQVNPFPPANYCARCSAPVDTWYASTKSSTDGTFTLDLAGAPAGATIQFVVEVGRFRKVTMLPIKACSANAAPKAAATLPGKSADGDVPKIAVATGGSDHLDQILTALGITEYDCYDGRAQAGGSTPTCKPVDVLSKLLTNQSAKKVESYHLLFISCAPGAYAAYGTGGVDMTMLKTNLAGFVTRGGRVFATDMSYDYVAQAFPADVTWMGPSGAPPPVDGANVGVGGSYSGTVDVPALKAWLTARGVNTTPTVPITGFLNPWSVQASLPSTSTLVVNGTVKYTVNGTATTGDVPLTSEFDPGHCGRVIYSSYHTASGTIDPRNLKPQERILEYLMFDVATCVSDPPK